MPFDGCNGIDDDCDGMIDEGAPPRTFYRDADGDSFGLLGMTMMGCNRPAGYVLNSTDCDDASNAVNPAAFERCDGVNNDCDTMTDEGCVCIDGRSMPCDVSTVGVCRSGAQLCIAGTWGACVGSVRPSAETCNGVDDDCDGMVDDGVTVDCYIDADSDTIGAGVISRRCPDPTRAGMCPSGYSNASGDCNDANASVRPMAVETCNGIDDDCDRMLDEGVLTTYYRDADSDGRGLNTMTTLACSAPSGYVALGGDCNDTNARIFPGAPELCDRVDNDCSSGGGADTAEDRDGDGHTAAGYTGCATGLPIDDCGDGEPLRHPGVLAYSDLPSCASLMPCRTGGGWGCSTARDASFVCTGAFMPGNAAHWDFDCSGVSEPQPSGSSVLCGLTCGFGSPPLPCARAIQPVYLTTAPACGEAITLQGCSGVCAMCSPSSAPGRMPCR